MFLVLSPVKAVVFIGVQQGLFGLYLGACFAPNHKGMLILDAADRSDFLRRQVLTSRNVRGGWLTDLAMGGLNYQIEHHLPLDAAAQPAPLPGPDQGILRTAWPALLRGQPGRLLRPGAAPPRRRRPGLARWRSRAPTIATVFFVLCQALGAEEVRQKLGVNATGLPFDALAPVERSADGRSNPMVNAGGIAAVSLVPGTASRRNGGSSPAGCPVSPAAS